MDQVTKVRERLTLREKEEIKKKANYTCNYCGCKNDMIMTIDHKIPLIRGGSDEKSNLVCCCYICNQLKGSLTDKEFRKYFKSLKTMHKLEKIKISIKDVKIDFYEHHNPGLKK